MFARWIDPHVRLSVALAVLLSSITGLVLADHRDSSNIWNPPTTPGLEIATGERIPQQPAGRTSVPFEGRGAHGRFAVSHGRVLASGTRPMYVEVRVAADSMSESVTPVRAPVALALVIDTSGSMEGAKIRDAKRAALAMLSEMHDDDQVAVVRYASDVEVAVPLDLVRNVRSRATAVISRMSANGNTDIANALRTTSTLFGWGNDSRVHRVVLVSDGRDTSGSPRGTASMVVRAQATRGITFSTLGIGTDFDEPYMADLAEVGHGNYVFLRDSSALAQFLGREFRETSRTTVQDVAVRLDLPSGVRIRETWGATWDGGGGSSLGSLFVGDERRIIVSLEVEAREPGTSMTLRGDVSWVPTGSSRVELSLPGIRVDSVASPTEVDDARDLSVLASVTSVQSSRREVEAAAAFERGDKARAVELNQQSVSALASAAAASGGADGARLEAQKKAYQQHNDVYSTQAPSAAPARDIGAHERANAARSVGY